LGIELIGRDFGGMTIKEFQKLISERYEDTDRARGTPKTFLWFIEEVGELATALNGSDRENLQEEFADVLAWLCTLANINDMDLSEAIEKKYLREGSSADPK
jgi:NTP pyrophosphatase (non-canonical NTP hydrolase)